MEHMGTVMTLLTVDVLLGKLLRTDLFFVSKISEGRVESELCLVDERP